MKNLFRLANITLRNLFSRPLRQVERAGESERLPIPPPRQETRSRSAFSFGPDESTYERRSEDTEGLISKMSASLPLLPRLLAAPTLDQQADMVRTELGTEDYERLILLLITIVFNYKEKDKRPRDALQLAELQLRVAAMLPDDWGPAHGIGLGRTRHLADSFGSLGSIYRDLGEPSRALDYFQQSEEYFARADRERIELGLEAESDFDRVLSKRDPRAYLFSNMALLYQEFGDTAKLIEYTRRAEELDRQRPTPGSRIQQLIDDGFSAAADDRERALRSFHKALDIALAEPTVEFFTRDVAVACHFIGKVLSDLQLNRRALLYHRRALELNQRSMHLERMSHDHVAIATILETRLDLGDALEHYESALQCASVPVEDEGPFTWRCTDGRLMQIIDPGLAWPAAIGAGQICADRKYFDRAETLFALAVEVGEAMRSKVVQDEYRIGFQANRLKPYVAMIRLQKQLAQQAQASAGSSCGHALKGWQYVERARGRAFLDALGTTPIGVPHVVTAELRDRESVLLERLRANARDGRREGYDGGRSEWNEYMTTRSELEEIWQNMIDTDPGAEAYVALRRGQPITTSELCDLLKEPVAHVNESNRQNSCKTRKIVLAEYFTFDDTALVFGMRSDFAEPEIVEIPLEEAQLRGFVRSNFGEHSQVREMSLDLEDLWHDYYDRLIEPITRWANPEDIIYLIPHGMLHYMPLHALRLEGRYLIERNPVIYSYSASMLKYSRARQGNDRAEVWPASVAVFGDSRCNLPHARDEALHLAELFRANPVLGEAVTRDALLSAFKKADLVHFAGHGFFHSREAMESGLKLANDSVLTARQIFDLGNLNADLVTLSGCETGVSENKPGDELIGLTRALLYAGAPSVLVSLWRVADDSTAFLMRQFYMSAAEDPRRSKVDALRQAILDTKSQPQWTSFYHWAPFVLVGDWR